MTETPRRPRRPEVWLRGPLPGIAPLLQPVGHALRQVAEDLEPVLSALTYEQLWTRFGDSASIGFHVTHLAGSLSRLFTYARGESLTPAQQAALAAESTVDATRPEGDALTRLLLDGLARAVRDLERIPGASLLEARDVGRARLPSTTLGLLVHAAEHSARHAGQVLTLARMFWTPHQGGAGGQPTLATPRLRLRPFVAGDATDVQRLAGDVRVADTTLNIPHPYADGMAESWIRSHPSAFGERKMVVFAITEAAGPLVGAVGLSLELEHHRAELGYWIGVPYWGRGYATEAARAVVAYGFRDLGLQRIDALHFTRNPASGRVLQKAGMTFEGTHRRHVWKNGGPEDLARYAILAPGVAPP